MQKAKRKCGKIFFICLAIVLGSSILMWAKSGKEALVEEHELARVMQVADERTEKFCNADFITQHYGSGDQISTSFVGRTITVTGVPQNVKVVAEMNYEGEPMTQSHDQAGAYLSNLFESAPYIPGADGTVVITIPETYQIPATNEQRTVSAASGSVILYFYPVKKYEDETHLCDTTDILFYKMPAKANEAISNPSYNASYCVDFRNKYSGVPEMREAVSYCFETAVDAEYDESTVKSWIKTAEETYQFKQKALAGKNQLTPDPEGTIPLGKGQLPSNEIKLSCDAFTTDVLDKDGKVIQYANSKKYSYQKTEKAPHGYCETTCKEIITVNFQAPVAVQAGLCFAYQVEVKSEVSCEAKSTGKYPKKKPVCVPTADCNGTYDWHHDQGGPEDDFDACIMKCDGGKYGQKCINQCYKEVYQDGSRVSQMLTYQQPVPATKTANVTCPPDSSDSKPTYGSWSAQRVYEFRQQYPGGHYEPLGGGSWKWVPGGTCSSAVGYYYFSTPELTAHSLSGFRSIYASWGNGFKMQDSDRFHCDSTCTWVGSCPSNSFQTPAEAAKDYAKQQAEEKSDWEYCSSKKTCNETTTVYTVTVDKDEEDSVNHKVYTATQKPDETGQSTEPSGDGIISDYSGRCYSKEDGFEYRNVITFPETWLSNKNGLTTNKKPTKTENYVYLGNTFCTSTKTPPVNLSWYNWKVYLGGTQETITEKLKEQVAKERKDNINVHIGKEKNQLWGLMGWNIDVNCFYAVEDPNYPPPTNPPSIPPTEQCPSYCAMKGGVCNCPPDTPSKETTVASYTFRPVSLGKDLFPNGRSARYNWSCDATNTLNKNYPVQPEAVIESIKEKGNSIYQDDSEIDYEIELDRATMKKVREYNKKHKGYANYTAAEILKSSEIINGVTVYKSEFLSDLGIEVLKKRGLIGCNNQDGESCSNAIVQNGCSQALGLKVKQDE